MIGSVEARLSRDAAAPCSKVDPGERWPVARSLMLAFGLSGVLWALIIAGVRWLIA